MWCCGFLRRPGSRTDGVVRVADRPRDGRTSRAPAHRRIRRRAVRAGAHAGPPAAHHHDRPCCPPRWYGWWSGCCVRRPAAAAGRRSGVGVGIVEQISDRGACADARSWGSDRRAPCPAAQPLVSRWRATGAGDVANELVVAGATRLATDRDGAFAQQTQRPRCTNIFRTNAVCVGRPFLAPLWITGLVRLLRTPAFASSAGRTSSCWQACTLRRAGPRCTSSAPTRRYLAAGGLAINGWLAGRHRSPRHHRRLCWQPQLSCVRRAAGAAGAAGGQSVRHSGTRQRSHGRAVGWPELAATVERCAGKLPAGQREHAVILTDDFGEAAAVERFAVDRSRIPVYSGQRGYADWGPPPELATQW